MTFFYYEVCLLKSPLANLTYQSAHEIKIGTLVTVPLRNRKNNSNAVVIEKVEKPTSQSGRVKSSRKTANDFFAIFGCKIEKSQL